MTGSGGARVALSGFGSPERYRFVAALIGAVLLFVLLKAAEPRTDVWFEPANRLTTDLAAGLLRASGLEVERSGTVLSHAGGHGVYIYYLCTPWPLALVMLLGLAALPGRPTPKLVAAGAGVAALVALNQLRLVSLFWVGVRAPDLYRFAHHWIGEPVMLLGVGVVWVLWLRHRPRPETKT